MRKRTKIAIGISTATVGVAMLLGVNFAFAENGSTTLTDRIAAKFNLNKTEVQKVVDDFQTEKRAEMEKIRTEELQKKVDTGTITAEQKTLIENKIKEIETQREALRDQNLTREEMQIKMQTSREELKTWAINNKIDLSLIMPLGKGGMRGNNMRGNGTS